MKRKLNNETSSKWKKVKNKAKEKIEKTKAKIMYVYGAFLCTIVSAFASPVHASAKSDGEKMWNDAVGIIQDYVPKIGIALIFSGLVMYGMGHKDDDARQKSMGINTMVAGLIVAVAASTLAPNLKIS